MLHRADPVVWSSGCGSRYSAFSGVMATTAVRWWRIPCLGHFGDLGITTAESPVQGAVAALADLDEISGFGLQIKNLSGVRSQILPR